MIFTGEPLTAERALAWGVANQLAPKAQVIDAAHALANKIAARAPIAVQMAKQAIDSDDAYQAMEQVSSAATAFTEDAVRRVRVLHRETRPALPRDLNQPQSTSTKALT